MSTPLETNKIIRESAQRLNHYLTLIKRYAVIKRSSLRDDLSLPHGMVATITGSTRRNSGLIVTLGIIMAITLLYLLGSGCADRKIIIQSEPPGAQVNIDGETKGITPCTIPFSYYGGRSLRLQKEGYQILKTTIAVSPPIFHIFPFDLLLVLFPYPLTDHHNFSYQLTKSEDIDLNKVLERGKQLKSYLQQKKP